VPSEGGGLQMSELKVYHHELRHNEYEEFYLKSEADKVITELEMKLAKAKLVLRLNEPKALYSNLDTMSRLNHKIDVVERRELHQKYKRCLAMASACDASMAYFGEFYDDASKRMVAHYYKWRGRWYELAERFKEAK
jgi:hypothetical protein